MDAQSNTHLVKLKRKLKMSNILFQFEKCGGTHTQKHNIQMTQITRMGKHLSNFMLKLG